MADIFGGIGLMIQAAKLATIRGVMTTVTFMTHSQVMSASALALMSVNCYVAVRHPIYLHTHAHTAKRNAALAIVSSWLVLSLFTFSPAMGWNCLDMPVADCFDFFHTSYMGILVAVALLCIVVMLFTNISVYIAIKQRQKRRLGQPGGVQDNNPGQNIAGQDQANNDRQAEADRKFKKSVHKARTVMIHVVVAIILWLLPLVVVPICVGDKGNCPLPVAIPVLITLNSAINPVAGIVRTPDLRKGIRENVASIHRALVTAIRGNRVNPQGEQPATVTVTAMSVQGGAATSGSAQKTPKQPTPKYSKSVSQGKERTKITHRNTEEPKTQNASLPIVEAD
ncbi:Gamma-tubulin complex component 5 [Branchiostoma belcheri]|nr:Gamma-tubulin complex component 5 [Branchiostoma belcheri]